MEKKEKLHDSDDESCERSVFSNGHSASVDLAGLRSWYEDYLNDDSLYPESPVLSILKDDVLDLDLIEKRVSSLSSHIHLDGVFCGRCQIVLNHWPVDPTRGNAHRTSQTVAWHSIFHVEAAAKRGCRFCSTMMHVLTSADHLHVFRCV